MLISHPANSISGKDKPLSQHLNSVAQKSVQILQSKTLNLKSIPLDDLLVLSYLIGLFHDFGKANNKWQSEIKKDNPDLPPHAHLSALMGMKVVETLFPKKPLYSYLIYLIIRRHHQDLISLDNVGKIQELKNLYRNIDNDVFSIYDEILKHLDDKSLQKMKDLDLKEIYSSLENCFRNGNLSNQIRRWNKLIFKLSINSNIHSIEFFFILNLLFSILIDNDKKDAADLLFEENIKAPNSSVFVDKYLEEKRKSDTQKFDEKILLNQKKNEFYEEVTKNENIHPQNYIYLLSAPTGIGKTFTAYSVALKLQSKLDFETKIIYALPYTSIIEQNYSEIEKILNFNLGPKYEKNSSLFLLKHHHLANFTYQSENYDSKSYLHDQLLVESWDSLNIITTFVQIFHSIIGYKNKFLKKFHNIVNSIIILDEIQNLPIEYRKLIQKTFLVLAKNFNIYFIFMSATQPTIFNDNEAIELGNQEYFAEPLFNRIDGQFIQIQYTLEDFFEEINNTFQNHKYQNCLLVCNTRKSAITLYNLIKESSTFKTQYQIFSLTNNLIPKHRKEKINLIQKKLQKNEKIIVVSTQLIEAGVDFDFEVVYRDFAPMDSIVQSAGRCNRFNKLQNKGKFFVINLIDNNNKNLSFAQCVYHPKLLESTREVFKTISSFDSSNFQEMTQSFFSKLNAQRDSDKLLRAIQHINYSQQKDNEIPIKEFAIIKNNIPRVNLLIVLDEESKLILSQYEKTLTITDKWERFSHFIKYKQKIQNYIIQISKTDLIDEMEVLTEGLYRLNLEQNSLVYNSEIGYNK